MKRQRWLSLTAVALLSIVGTTWLWRKDSHQITAASLVPSLPPQPAPETSGGPKGEDRYWQGHLSSQFKDAKDVFDLIGLASTYLKRCEAEPNLTPEQQYECRWGVFYPMNMWLRAHRNELQATLQARPCPKEASDDERALYLYATLVGHALKGHPDRALKIYRTLKKEPAAPTFMRYLSPVSIQTLHTASQELKRISATEISPDQHLWELGQAYQRLEKAPWNQVDDGSDPELSNACFERILKQHPTSPFADNAWWELHALNGWDNEENWTKDYLESIAAAYREFLHRFPDSEKVALARVYLARQIQACIAFAEEFPHRSNALPISERRAWLLEAQQLCLTGIRMQESEVSIGADESHQRDQTLLAEIEANLARYPAVNAGQR